LSKTSYKVSEGPGAAYVFSVHLVPALKKVEKGDYLCEKTQFWVSQVEKGKCLEKSNPRDL